MRVIFWGRILPNVIESVVNELNNGTRKLQICIQVDPAVKATEFSSPYLDEVIRENAFSFDALERKLVERREPALLVLDLWGFLFTENVLKLVQDLRPAFNLARRTLILMPKTWLGQWEDSPTCQTLSRSLRQEMNVFFQRLVGAFELLWNTDGPEIYCLQSAPTFELLELVTGQMGLVPRKVLGIHFLPKACRSQTARFASVAKLTHEVLSFLNLPTNALGERIDRDAVTPWVCSLDADVLYGPVQSKGEGRSPFAKLSPELLAAGIKTRTPTLDHGLLVMSCRWDSYVRVEGGKRSFWAIPPAAMSRTGGMNFPSPEAAAWLHLLGLLEQSSPLSHSKLHPSGMQTTFPLIYHPMTPDHLDETVMS